MKNNVTVGTIICKFSLSDFVNIKRLGALMCAPFERISFDELSAHSMIVRRFCDEIFGEGNVVMSPYQELCGHIMHFGYVIHLTCDVEENDLAIVERVISKYFFEILDCNDQINDLFVCDESEVDMSVVNKMKDEFLESNSKKMINRPFIVEINGVEKLKISGKIIESQIKTQDKFITRNIIGYVDGLLGHERELHVKNNYKDSIIIGFNMEKFGNILHNHSWDHKMYRLTVSDRVNGKGRVNLLLTDFDPIPVEEKFILN